MYSASATDQFAPPLLARLREATRPLHDQIEAAPALVRLVAPDLRRAEYAAALQGQFRFHAALQDALPARLVSLGIAWPMPSHALAALAADLAALGTPEPGATRWSGARRGFGAVGALYVLEGSLLGGRVIGRHIAASVGVTPQAGGAFFRGTTADGARARWRGFCGLLAGLPLAAEPSLIEGALGAFGFFLTCLDGPCAAAKGIGQAARTLPRQPVPAAGAADHF